MPGTRQIGPSGVTQVNQSGWSNLLGTPAPAGPGGNFTGPSSGPSLPGPAQMPGAPSGGPTPSAGQQRFADRRSQGINVMQQKAQMGPTAFPSRPDSPMGGGGYSAALPSSTFNAFSSGSTPPQRGRGSGFASLTPRM